MAPDKASRPSSGRQAPLDKVEETMRQTGEADERDNPGHEREAGQDGDGHSPAGAPPPDERRDT